MYTKEVLAILHLHICRCGGIGRRAGLKIRWGQLRVGSTPTTGTIKIKRQKPRSPDLIGTRMSENTISASCTKIYK